MNSTARNAPPAYQAALDYLYSFVDYETKMPPSPQHARFNHGRMRLLLDALGRPQHSYPSVVVAGTKGKGSTCAFTESILRHAGYRTGLYTSPHLHSWRERVQVERRLITQNDVVRYVELLKPIVERLDERGQPTLFELTTALALRYFADQAVDVAILEIGMGGRYDSVNVVTPAVSAITPISYDHMAVLGTTLPEIAANKAGIVKPGVPVVVAPQWMEAETEIRREAEQLGAPMYRAELDGLRRVVPDEAAGPTALTERPEPLAYPVPIRAEGLGLGGAHQLENARVAAGITLLLRPHGFVVDAAAVAAGLRDTRWPGRFEVVGREPTIVLDGAQNAASAGRLREALNSLGYRRLILVLGTSRDKDIDGIVRELVPGADAVVLTRSRHPRSATVEQLEAHVLPLLRPNATLLHTDDVPPALAAARGMARPSDLICVTGSLFPVAAAREALGIATEVD